MNIIKISDLNASELDAFARKTEPQLREEGEFLAETAYVIIRAIEAGYEPLAMLVESARMKVEAEPVFEAVRKYCGEEVLEKLPIYTAPQEVVAGIVGYHLVRGLWMVLRRKPQVTLEEFCKDKKRLTVLVDVVNPANVGAIIRSAAALGMDGVLLTHPSVDPLTRRVARVSMGTVFQIPWVKAGRDESEAGILVKTLQSYGFKTVAMALTSDSTNIDNDEIRKNEKLAVLLGTEGTGLPKAAVELSDYKVMIPMSNGVDSLNVAAASAISFWELLK